MEISPLSVEMNRYAVNRKPTSRKTKHYSGINPIIWMSVLVGTISDSVTVPTNKSITINNLVNFLIFSSSRINPNFAQE
jgi:hypothetical protein